MVCNTNTQERLNGELADRFGSARGVNGEDSPIFRVAIIHHNFIRPHGGMGGRTPAEAAGIEIRAYNKWLALIQNAAAAAWRYGDARRCTGTPANPGKPALESADLGRLRRPADFRPPAPHFVRAGLCENRRTTPPSGSTSPVRAGLRPRSKLFGSTPRPCGENPARERFIAATTYRPLMDRQPDVVDFMHPCSQWAKKRYAAQMAANKHKAPHMPGELNEEMTESHILTWFLFQWINPDTEITPAEEFARGMDDKYDWVGAARSLAQMKFGTFRVLEMLEKGFGVVDDIDTAETYPVGFRVGYDVLRENDVFVGYIHPWPDGAYYTIGTIAKVGSLPKEFITPGMTNMLVERFMRERQERYESVPITARTGIATYLKSQLADHVTKVAGSLGITGRTKKQKIILIRAALAGPGAAKAVKSLPPSHVKCLEAVAAAGLVKRHVLKRKMGGEADAIMSELYRRGLLMLGTKAIGGRRHKVAAVPADVLRNAVERGLLNLGRWRRV